LGLGAGVYFLVTRTPRKGSKKKKKSKAKSASEPSVTTLSFLVRTKNPDEEGTTFEVDFEGSPNASEVRTTIEDDVLTPWLDSEFLNEGFRVYYKNPEGSFLMSNHTPFKTLHIANAVVVVISTDRMLPEPDDEPEQPGSKRTASKTKASRTGGSHELLPTGDEDDEDEV